MAHSMSRAFSSLRRISATFPISQPSKPSTSSIASQFFARDHFSPAQCTGFVIPDSELMESAQIPNFPPLILKSSFSVFSRSRALCVSSATDSVVSETNPSSASLNSLAFSGALKSKAMTKRVKHIMNILDLEAKSKAQKERELPKLSPGDVISMKLEMPENKRRISTVKGIVIAIRNAGISSTFRVRRVLAGVGVEMVFPMYSPNIKEIQILDKRKVRRAKLYYLREKNAKLSTFN